jgi:hypothetical protein
MTTARKHPSEGRLTKWLFLTIALKLSLSATAADTNATTLSTPDSANSTATPQLHVTVDPRVELMSLLFRLAGNDEYNKAKVPSYTADVEKQFNPFRDHAAVKLAGKLRQSRGVSYNAPMGLALQWTDACEPQLIVPPKAWPEAMDPRWRLKDATNFSAAARQFVKDSGFKGFLEQHQALYDTTVSRMGALMDKEAHLEWFQPYFGERPQAGFTVALGLLNGPCNYGGESWDAAGNEELFCILGVWDTDKQGLPVFRKELMRTVVHEFCHPYANPIILRHKSELDTAGRKLFRPVADQMRSQAYREASSMLCESLVRASVVRYLRHYDGPKAAEREIRLQQRLGFLWMQELSDLLGQYEAERDRYPTLESFSPRLVAFFNDYAKGFSAKTVAEAEQALDSRRPQVVSLTPTSGARNVDPALKAIQVVFDRPMNGESNIGPGGPHFPEMTGQPHYDEQRITWTLPVKLKPGWKYEFYLNLPGDYQAFQSEEGVPLKPVLVRFKTGLQAPEQVK